MTKDLTLADLGKPTAGWIMVKEAGWKSQTPCEVDGDREAVRAVAAGEEVEGKGEEDAEGI